MGRGGHITMKKRIAVCFYGKIRREDFFNEDYSKWDSDEYDFDFFIATWEHDFNITLPFVKSNVLNENNFNLKFFSPNARVAKACYLINKVIRLKEEYEMKNGFVYDLVVCTRGDVRQKKFSYFCDALNTTLLTAKLNTSRPIVSVASTIRAIEKENVPCNAYCKYFRRLAFLCILCLYFCIW